MKNIQNELVIKNSRFICFLYRIKNIGEVSKRLEEIRVSYPKATHYCYAYILGQDKKYNDDGEPSKTAGSPILNVLEKEDLNEILCIVVRYFGGIKLGVGGLVRAYSKSTSEALSSCQFLTLTEGYLIKVSVKYQQVSEFLYLVKEEKILSREFLEDVVFLVEVSTDVLQLLKTRFQNCQILKKVLIEK